jgi:ketosteroid isomerase-like protein
VSAEDVELLRRAYAARSLDEFGEYLHPDAVLHQAAEIPDSDTYHGREEFLRGLGRWLEDWERFRYVPVEVLEAPNGIFMQLNMVGRGKGSGVKIEQQVFNVWEMRDGLAWRCKVYWDEEPARREAGL